MERICGNDLRPHDDLDFLILHSEMAKTIELLQEMGFGQVHGSVESGNVFFNRDELLLDLVPVLENPPRTLGELASIQWPAEFLSEHFVQSIRTLTPEMHREMKTLFANYYGLDMRQKDQVDLAALKKLS